jgi:hypothetical protein
VDLAVVVDAASIHSIHVGAFPELDQLCIVLDAIQHPLQPYIVLGRYMEAHDSCFFFHISLPHHVKQNQRIHPPKEFDLIRAGLKAAECNPEGSVERSP